MRTDAVLCLVLDGSTSGPSSGNLARKIIHNVVDWYVGSSQPVTTENLTAHLRCIHRSLSHQFPLDSASYLIACISDAETFVLHAGDCMLGSHEENGSIQWLTKPHTLANATHQMPIDEIARSHVRHRLTRSFRAREFVIPEMSSIQTKLGSSFIAATDGYWAELSLEEQNIFMRGEDLPMAVEADDRSVLRIRLVDDLQGAKVSNDNAPENLYIKRR